MIIKWLFKMTWTMMTWLFNVTIKLSYSKQHDSWYVIEEWLLCNDMDNIEIVVSNDYEIIKIWWINWKLITNWLMYNDMGHVDHLPTYILPTHPPTHELPNPHQFAILWSIQLFQSTHNYLWLNQFQPSNYILNPHWVCNSGASH